MPPKLAMLLKMFYFLFLFKNIYRSEISPFCPYPSSGRGEPKEALLVQSPQGLVRPAVCAWTYIQVCMWERSVPGFLFVWLVVGFRTVFLPINVDLEKSPFPTATREHPLQSGFQRFGVESGRSGRRNAEKYPKQSKQKVGQRP